jgi:hypothetical protein
MSDFEHTGWVDMFYFDERKMVPVSEGTIFIL